MTISLMEQGFRLLIAMILGSIKGFERRMAHKPAGIKTHSIICVTTCMITMVASYGLGKYADPSKIIGNILTGLGFLCAGVIIKETVNESTSIKGLTTAAGIWSTAMIGIPIGLGYIWLSILTFAIIQLAIFLDKLVKRLTNGSHNADDDE
jgi:putative Mg2+ transporter-C (MgtC) family protein